MNVVEERAARDTSAEAPRRIIVTGGASGIGRATAQTIALDGARVVVVDVDAERGSALANESVAAGHDLSFVRADVSRADELHSAIDDAISRLGGVDVLVTAAGIMRGQLMGIEEHVEQMWDQVLDVNLKGAFLAVRQVVPVMIEAGGGVIILVGSKGGVTVGSGSFSYGASKGGVHGLSLTLERHLGPRGIRVHDVCPGDVDTPLYRRSVQEGVEHGGDAAAAEARLGQLTDPEEIADVIAFLASDAASAVRGTIFTA